MANKRSLRSGLLLVRLRKGIWPRCEDLTTSRAEAAGAGWLYSALRESKKKLENHCAKNQQIAILHTWKREWTKASHRKTYHYGYGGECESPGELPASVPSLVNSPLHHKKGHPQATQSLPAAFCSLPALNEWVTPFLAIPLFLSRPPPPRLSRPHELAPHMGCPFAYS